MTRCPGRVNLTKRLTSICKRSPGHGHSKRLTCSLGAGGSREQPRRRRHRQTVAWLIPSSEAISRGRVRCAAAPADAVMHTLAAKRGLAVRGRWRYWPEPRSALQLARGAIPLDPVLHRGNRHPPPLRGPAAAHAPHQTQLHQLDTLQLGSRLRFSCIGVLLRMDLWKDPQRRLRPGCLISRWTLTRQAA